MYLVFGTYLYLKIIIIYLKFDFNWVSFILFYFLLLIQENLLQMLYRIALLDLTSERKGEGKNTHTAGNAQTHNTD